jgi:hypothetical protein
MCAHGGPACTSLPATFTASDLAHNGQLAETSQLRPVIDRAFDLPTSAKHTGTSA